MATYKFPQFNTEIKDPTITANEDTIGIQPTKNTINVTIDLVTDSAKIYGLNLEGIKVENLSWESYENLMFRVMERLEDFEV